MAERGIRDGSGPMGRRGAAPTGRGGFRPWAVPLLAFLIPAAGVAGCEPAGGDGGGLAAGAAASAPVPEEERYGGTVVVAGTSDLETMNALVSSEPWAQQHQMYVLFTPLVRFDSTWEARPWLAESWDVSGDGTRVTFHLRDDVSWHDGEPVTAADVKFTFDRAKDPRVPFPNRSYFDLWQEAEVLDEHTVRFYLRPHQGWLYGWARTAIMPEHILGDVPPGELASHPFGTVAPVGSGPFRFVEHVPDGRWVFEANADHPDGLGGRPYIDRLVYRVIPEPTTRVSELRTGGVHLLVDVPPGQLRRLRRDSARTALETYSFPSYAFIAWNPQRPFFDHRELRRALTMAIDRIALVDAVRGGLGEPAVGPVGPWHWAYDPEWRPLPYAPDSARAILDRHGWTDRDGDGIREKDGIPFAFDLLTSESPERRDAALIVQADLARIGVRATPRVRDAAAVAAAVTSPDRRFDALLAAWTRDILLNDRDLWACDQIGQPFQFTSYCNPELDPVLDSIPLVADRDRLRGLLERYRRAIVADQPYTFLYYDTHVDARRRGLQGFDPDARGAWASVADWWLLPSVRVAAGD